MDRVITKVQLLVRSVLLLFCISISLGGCLSDRFVRDLVVKEAAKAAVKHAVKSSIKASRKDNQPSGTEAKETGSEPSNSTD